MVFIFIPNFFTPHRYFLNNNFLTDIGRRVALEDGEHWDKVLISQFARVKILKKKNKKNVRGGNQCCLLPHVFASFTHKLVTLQVNKSIFYP